MQVERPRQRRKENEREDVRETGGDVWREIWEAFRGLPRNKDCQEDYPWEGEVEIPCL